MATDAILLILGVSIIALVLADIVRTTLSSNGGGFLTNAVAAGVWKLFFLASSKRGRATLLTHAGMMILISIILAWVLSLWLGVFLVLLSDAGSIVTDKGAASNAMEKLYFAGFSLSTLGVGDYKANSDGWRLVTTAAAFAGLIFMTVSVTYFVPVLSAVTAQRTLAFHIRSLGLTPEDIVRNSWDGSSFGVFVDACDTLDSMLIEHTFKHYTYPVLHYFHSADPALAFPRNIVVFAEAFYLIRYGARLAPSQELKLKKAETFLDAYLEAMRRDVVHGVRGGEPPPLDSGRLRSAGLPLRTTEELAQALSRHDIGPKRAVLGAVLVSDGWDWNDVACITR
ncbi:two pore domain potassium channel family protein [Massilia sp. UMI-21]|nr:two pore domain potassium channel family protein [Massilia sp. UMI-21]